MGDQERHWKTDPIKKFGDVAPPPERIRRRLPPDLRHGQMVKPTPEIEQLREADAKFRIKRST